MLFIEKKKKENAPKNTNPEPGMLGNSGTGEAVPGMMPGMNPAMMAGMNPAMMAGMDPAMMAGMAPAMMVEKRLAEFVGKDDAIVYSTGF